VTYWLASGRRIGLLTVFVKTRMRETREIERAQRTLRTITARGDDDVGTDGWRPLLVRWALAIGSFRAGSAPRHRRGAR